MSSLTRDQILLAEWNACEATIRNLDGILTQIRFYGFTITIGLMGAAAETLRSPQAFVNINGVAFHISFIIEALSTIFIILLWIFHEHYLQFLLKAVNRQREIEQKELLIDGKEILKLGQTISRRDMPIFIRDPWRWLFIALLILGLILMYFYAQPQIMIQIP